MRKLTVIKLLKRLVIFAVLASLLVYGAIVLCNKAVINNAVGKTYDDIHKIPQTKVALLLGVGKYMGNGSIDAYYTFRVKAAVDLYLNGKIEYIIISGDNSRKEYDEPSTFKEDLVEAGIPEDKIYLDYAGFRTLDSVVRCKAIFGQDKILIISQKFHNERAIYLAENNDMQAIGFNAEDVSKLYGKHTAKREKLARVKMFLDIIMGKEPKFYGEKIEIGI